MIRIVGIVFEAGAVEIVLGLQAGRSPLMVTR